MLNRHEIDFNKMIEQEYYCIDEKYKIYGWGDTKIRLDDLRDEHIPFLIRFLKEHPRIIMLELGSYRLPLTCKGAATLINDIGNTEVIIISFAKAQLVDYQYKNNLFHLEEAIKNNTSLKSLNLYGVGIPLHGVIQALFNNTSLESLKVECSGNNDADAENIADLLINNKTLKKIDIYGSTYAGIKAITKAIAQNTTLQSLSYQASIIGRNDALDIASMLQFNKTLKSLTLYGCAIDNIGANNIAKAVFNHESLTLLSLRANEIGDKGAEALSGNTTLLEIDLSKNNDISVDAMETIRQRVEKNKLLKPARSSLLFEKALNEDTNSPIYALNSVPEIAGLIYHLVFELLDKPDISSLEFSRKVRDVAFTLRNNPPLLINNDTNDFVSEEEKLVGEIKSQISIYNQQIEKEKSSMFWISETGIKIWSDKIAVLEAALDVLSNKRDADYLKEKEYLHEGWKDSGLTRITIDLVERVKKLKGLPLDWYDCHFDRDLNMKENFAELFEIDSKLIKSIGSEIELTTEQAAVVLSAAIRKHLLKWANFNCHDGVRYLDSRGMPTRQSNVIEIWGDSSRMLDEYLEFTFFKMDYLNTSSSLFFKSPFKEMKSQLENGTLKNMKEIKRYSEEHSDPRITEVFRRQKLMSL